MNRPQSDASVRTPTPLDLYSLHHLEALLGHSRVELEDLAKHATRFYKPFPLKRKEHLFSRKTQPAKKRSIDNPINPLKAIQARIEDRLLKRIILWEHGGPIVDLENLILPGSGLTVIGANLINDRGEIAGTGVLPNGDTHAILLIPCDENHADVEGCDYSMVDASSATRKSPASMMTTAPRGPTLNDSSKTIHKMLTRPVPYPRGERSETLTGYCMQPSYPGPGCRVTSDPTHCPLGQPARNPGVTTCGESGPIYVDGASRCAYKRGASFSECEVTRP